MAVRNLYGFSRVWVRAGVTGFQRDTTNGPGLPPRPNKFIARVAPTSKENNLATELDFLSVSELLSWRNPETTSDGEADECVEGGNKVDVGKSDTGRYQQHG